MFMFFCHAVCARIVSVTVRVAVNNDSDCCCVCDSDCCCECDSERCCECDSEVDSERDSDCFCE